MLRRMTLVLALLASSTTYSAPDLFIGTQGLGHVSPAAAWPFGMVQAGPDTSPRADRYVGDWKHTCGYQHDDPYLCRFSQCRFYGIGCGTGGLLGLLPGTAPFATNDAVNAVRMIKSGETARPGYYAVRIESGVFCEMSALAHTAAYRFSFPEEATARLLVDADWGIFGFESDDADDQASFGRKVYDGAIRLTTHDTAFAHLRQLQWNDIECWAKIVFSHPVKSKRRLNAPAIGQGEIWEYDFGAVPGGVLEVRLGLSTRSVLGAERNLAAEMPVFDFDGVRTKAAAEWARRLSVVTLDPSTPEPTKTIFESAFYRTMIHPSDLGDVGEHAYSNLSLWDIFRACSPLQTITAPDVTAGTMRSMVEIYEKQGYLPILHAFGGENHCMVGHHAVPIIVDAYLKGIGGFDAGRAYEAVKDSLTRMHVKGGEGTWGLLKEDWDLLDRYGYYPFDLLSEEGRDTYHGRKVRGESVSRLLECAYDDACAARFAAALGRKDDAAFFVKRAQNWRNVYDASVGFMRGKDSKGRWREPFDPKSCGAGPWAENDFTEGNAWQYTWHVMHDIPGLVAAMGGKTAFGAKLQSLFGQTDEVYGTSFTHDVSGLIGQYAHGNEPSHHVAYLFRFSDRPEKTDEYVNRICRELYRATPDGCCGNDDSGQMAAWYVFSALGFYPVDACGGEYVIGCPQVPLAQVKAGGEGRTFKILAKGFSNENKSVKSVALNGKPIADWKIRHADIMKGGVLEFEMGAREVVIRPDGDRDMTKEIVEAVRTANAAGGGTVRLEKGVYHLFAASAEKMSFHISNHDQPNVRPVFLPFVGVRNVTVESEGAHLVIHGMGTALLLQGTEGFTLRGVTISWAKPYFARGTVAGFENGRTCLCFPARDEVVVRDGKLVLLGEDWEHRLIGGNVYDGKTHEILEGTADVMLDGANETCADGSVLVGRNLLAVGAKVGDVYVLRSWSRPHPAICLDRARDTVFEDVVYRDGFGMGIVAQLSENFRMSGGGCFPASADDYCSNTFDATHFSNCRGQVTVENCRFEGMHDDALNVHSTCLGVIAKTGADAIRCRYMHEQAVGFGVFSAGDTVRFIRGRTLENGWMCRVKSVRTIDEREVELTLEDVVPEGYGVGDAVENADWQCAVVFRNNVIRNNRARGVLFTTPKKIVCEGNFFDHVSGSAILLAGDAQGWYESGACWDVMIRRNRFRNCLTSSYQYCDALVSIHPEVKDLSGQRQRYHRNVTIEDNDIETFDIPLLYVLSAENLVWKNNRVTFNSDYAGWKRKRFETRDCENVRIDGFD